MKLFIITILIYLIHSQYLHVESFNLKNCTLLSSHYVMLENKCMLQAAPSAGSYIIIKKLNENRVEESICNDRLCITNCRNNNIVLNRCLIYNQTHYSGSLRGEFIHLFTYKDVNDCNSIQKYAYRTKKLNYCYQENGDGNKHVIEDGFYFDRFYKNKDCSELLFERKIEIDKCFKGDDYYYKYSTNL
jgi:hypothetical protein